MQYDISTLASDAEILSAELRLYKHSNHVSYTFPGTFVAQSITSDWDENGVTWDQGWSTKGGDISTEVLDIFEYDGSYNGWFTFDVTEALQQKLVDPQSSYGLMVHIPGDPATGLSETNQESYFYSSECSESGKTPHITVTLAGTSVVAGDNNLAPVTPIGVQNRTLSVSVSEHTTVELYSLSGQLVNSYEFTTGEKQISLHHLAQGCFLLKLQAGEYERSQLIRVE